MSIYLVTDPKQSLQETCDTVHAAARAGASWIQLRRKHDTYAELKQLVQSVQQSLLGFDVQLIMNDAIDIAQELNMSGVHLGQSDTCVIEARKRLGDHKIVGLTVETWEQLVQAQDLPIDYIGISSLFQTSTKLDIKHVWGLEKLQQACAFSQIPLVAIGGIQAQHLHQFQSMNLHSVAVTSAITQAPCAFTATKHFLKQLKHQI